MSCFQPALPKNSDPETLKRRRPQGRTQELLTAALASFVERGFAATTCEAVAVRAGVSKGTLYLYFHSKEALFKAVITHHLQAPIADGERLMAEFRGSSADLLCELMKLWREHVVMHQASGICKVIMAEARNFPLLATYYVDQLLSPGQKLVSSAIQQGVASGEFRPVAIEHAAQMFLATPVFLASYRHSLGACERMAPTVDETAVLNAQIDLLLHGLRSPADQLLVSTACDARRGTGCVGTA